MNLCAWTKQNISSYIDHELTEPDRVRVESHVAGCAGCESALAATLRVADACSALEPEHAPAIGSAVMAALAYEQAAEELVPLLALADEQPPADLRQRIAAATYQRRQWVWRSSVWLRPAIAGAAGIAAVALLAAVAPWSSDEPASPPPNQAAAVQKAPVSAPEPNVAHPAPAAPNKYASLPSTHRFRNDRRVLPAPSAPKAAVTAVRALPLPPPKIAERTAPEPEPLPEVALLPEPRDANSNLEPADAAARPGPIRIVDARPAEEFLKQADSRLLSSELQERIRRRSQSSEARRASELSDIRVVEVKLLRAEF